MPPAPQHSTPERLRDDIDRGATGDKTPGIDPAAAPLGADDEAAGMPPQGAALPGEHQRPKRGPVPPSASAGGVAGPGYWLMWGLVLVVFILIALGTVWTMRG